MIEATDELPTLPEELPPGTLWGRYRRSVANSRKRLAGIPIPVQRRAWHITLTAIELPDFVLQAFAVPSLPHDGRSLWLRRRMFAQRLAEQDVAAGGNPQWECVEFRRCAVCKRILLGAAAHEYQQKMRRPRAKWEFPKGPACGVECTPKIGSVRRALD